MPLPKFLQSIVDMFFPNPLKPATEKLASGTKKLSSVEDNIKKIAQNVSAILAAVAKPEEISMVTPSGEKTQEALLAALLDSPEKGKAMLLKYIDVDVNGVTLRKTATEAIKTFANLDNDILGGGGDITEGLAAVAEGISAAASDPVKAATVAAQAKSLKDDLTNAQKNVEKLNKQAKGWSGLLKSLA